jgi:Spy/CpxP family protein refolding chaperone
MQRSKQQALTFLLGAVLVGGALGFSADRYIGHEKFTSQYGPRGMLYDQLGLTTQQRATIDSLTFQQDCLLKSAGAPLKPKLDSIRNNFRAQWRQVLTADQQAKWDKSKKEHDARREADQAKEPKRQCSGN